MLLDVRESPVVTEGGVRGSAARAAQRTRVAHGITFRLVPARQSSASLMTNRHEQMPNATIWWRGGDGIVQPVVSSARLPERRAAIVPRGRCGEPQVVVPRMRGSSLPRESVATGVPGVEFEECDADLRCTVAGEPGRIDIA